MLNKIYSKVDLPPSARQPANNGRILPWRPRGDGVNFGVNSLYYDRICSSRRRRQAVASAVGARRPGSGLLRRDPLIWAPQWHTSKIEEGWSRGLGWPPFCQYTQQPNEVQLRRGELCW